jgi:hypothetical protein
LRAAGDRNGLWQTLERTLIGDVAIIIGAAMLTAALLHTFADVSLSVLTIYVAGCTIGPIFAGYFAISRRAHGAGLRGLRFLFLLAFLFTIILGPRTLGAIGVAPLCWLLAILGVLALGCRYLARRRLLQMDWCAVRPSRRPT